MKNTSTHPRCKILLVDDELSYDQMLRNYLAQFQSIVFVDLVSDGLQAVCAVKTSHPEIVIMDIHLPEMDGFEMTFHILRRHPATQILILTAYIHPQNIVTLRQLGVAGIISKNEPLFELEQAIMSIRTGGSYFSPSVTAIDVCSALPLKPISRMEYNIALMVLDGMTSEQIAESLVMAKSTVDTHRQNILNKLNLPNITALGGYLLRNGVIWRKIARSGKY